MWKLLKAVTPSLAKKTETSEGIKKQLSQTGFSFQVAVTVFLCKTLNFGKRIFCFECQGSMKDCALVEEDVATDAMAGEEKVGQHPSDTLLFRGLDALTTEDSLNRALQYSTGMWCSELIVMRDSVTNTSESYAFGKMESIKEATEVLAFLKKFGPLEADGKHILVSVSREKYSVVRKSSQLAAHVPLPKQNLPPTPQERSMVQVAPQSKQPAAAATTASPSATATATAAAAAATKSPRAVKRKNVKLNKAKLEAERRPSVPQQPPEKRTVKVEATAEQNVTKSAVKDSKSKTTLDKKEIVGADDINIPGTGLAESDIIKLKHYVCNVKTGQYYVNSKMQCPVPECLHHKQKAKPWFSLMKHWFAVHMPVRKAYVCPHSRCTKDVVYTVIKAFYNHLKTHPSIPEARYEEIRMRTTSHKMVPNAVYEDPGSTTLPMPTPCASPQVEIPETKCPVASCPHSYTTVDKMRQHWDHYHCQRTTMYRCDTCDLIQRKRKLMEAHMTETHGQTHPQVESVFLESKQYIDPGNVVPFWALYRSAVNAEDDEDNEDEDDDSETFLKKFGSEFKLTSIPSMQSHPDDLYEFLKWTDKYMDRLKKAHVEAITDLQKITRRMADKS